VANSIATFGPAAALVAVSFAGCNVPLIMAMLCLAVGLNGAIYSGEQSTILDIAPNFAGTNMGIINGLGNIMGFVAPQVSEKTLLYWMSESVRILLRRPLDQQLV
jgi:MFS family permease